MTKELKPCPFCGCEVKIVIGIYGLHGAPDYYTIVHPENDCIMNEFACYSTDEKDELINDWNKRIEMKNLLEETNLFFKMNGLNWEDETARVNSYGKVNITSDGYITAGKWDGNPEYVSWYA